MRTLCYVASPSFSGSTLLTFLLGAHPGIATVGELKGRLYTNLEVPRRCSCGSPVPDCPFWRRVAERLAAQGVACDLNDIDTYFHAPRHDVVDRLLRARVRGPVFETLRGALLRVWPGARRELARLVERNRALVEVICEIQGGGVLLDSSKDAVRLKFLAEAGLWDVRVVHLLRDGRGTANSFRRRSGLPIERGARRWLTAHDSFRTLFRTLPENAVYRLRYEDLCADPARHVAEVIDFLGLPPTPLPRDFLAGEHHVFGNPMRLRDSSEIRIDEGWREDLGPDDLGAFERVAGARNRDFGYAP